MASRRRQGQKQPPPQSPQPSVSPDRSSQSHSSSSSSSSSSTAPPRPPFYNTTFSTHRVSPLYIGSSPLDSQRLQTLAHRLRDTLVGDVVRGVEVGLGRDDGEGIMGQYGSLEAIAVSWVRVASVLDIVTPPEEGSDNDEEDEENHIPTSELRKRRAIHISLQYEATVCTALLMPALGGREEYGGRGDGQLTQFSVGGGAELQDTDTSGQFITMPLLLLRMPAPLKSIIADFLSTAFDCRVSSLHLGTRSMVRAWESWVKSAGLPSRGPLAKDVVLSLGFHIPPPAKESEGEQAIGTGTGKGDVVPAITAPAESSHLGLKSVDIIIPATELHKFVDAGLNINRLEKRKKRKTAPASAWGWEDDVKKRTRLAGRLHEEGWEWRRRATATTSSTEETDVDKPAPPLEWQQQPFTEALGRYLDHHLALNLFHPSARIVKIACGGFAMSEGRLKVFAPADLRQSEDGGDARGQRAAVWELLRDVVYKKH
ncbi:kinetochore complex Sim4 subunit Fta1-domain-containing protein [Bombardia bombarda]|uniref:Kinetochore complex Sim4 subunit Fta1-domain-containing protein n=1 Tax=Bombardia bombarda TaxID=252184 RepID=A0AA40C2K7_9PEZI|nr:kinetochore complex Sim4 subunit Fta1-domain-containing protein [Bombardia bombarda]